MTKTADSERVLLVRRAFRLEWLTAAWMTLEAAVALGAGIAARSLTLVAFGADSVIELLSAGVLLWRLTVEFRRGQVFSEKAERLASTIGALLLSALVIYIAVSAAWGLRARESQEFSVIGLALAAVAIPAMYLLAKAKFRIADRIGSRALRADAMESVTCGYLSVVVVIGLMAQWLLHAWWVDSVSALALVPFLIREAQEAWKADD